MALQKQGIDVSFAQGLDTKTDPFRVQAGKFLSLENSIFDKAGRLTKRNGYGPLAALPNATTKLITTFNGNLTAIGDKLQAFSAGSNQWIDRGPVEPASLTTLPVIRSNTSQTQVDAVVAPNGLSCVAYTDNIPSTGGQITQVYKYAIVDAITSQNIVIPQAITCNFAPRVFLLGNFFIILYVRLVSATYHLSYIAISTFNPTQVTAVTDISTQVSPTSTLNFDGYVANNNLYMAWNGSDIGGAIRVSYIDSFLNQHNTVSFATYTATQMSVTADLTQTTPVIWVSFYDVDKLAGYSIALNPILVTILAPTAFQTPVTFNATFSAGSGAMTVSSTTGISAGMFIKDNTTPSNIAASTLIFQVIPASSVVEIYPATQGNSAGGPGDSMSAGFAIANLTSSAQNGIVTLFYEVSNIYPYDPYNIPIVQTDYINKQTVTQAGSVSASSTIVRSLGLASKSFIVAGNLYMMAAYQSTFQPGYYLINSNGNVIARLAYQNGGGYLTTGLPNITVNDHTIQIPYLFKDLVQSVNKTQGIANAAGIYAQTGINLVTFDIGLSEVDASEIGNNLNFSGGFLWGYDGYTAVENNFFVFPEDPLIVPLGNQITNGTITSGSNVMTSVVITNNIDLVVGMNISGTGIPGGTTVVSFNAAANTITMSANATTSGTFSMTFFGSMTAQQYFYQITYEWSDDQGNIYRSAPSIPYTVIGTTGQVILYIPTLRLTYKVINPVKIVLYRWSAGQQAYYQTTSIQSPLLNDPTVDYVVYTDIHSDAQIIGNELIYTSGGVLENTSTPATNIMTLFNNRLWLVDSEDRNLLWFSKQVIEATPVEMSDLLTMFIAPTTASQGSTGPITALAPMDDKLIIFKRDALGYINGIGPDNTGANNQYSDFTLINAVVGCTVQKSIVFTPQGLMFQSSKGIWLLGRDLSTTYIGAPVESLTIGATVLSAVNVPATTQVRFTLDSGITLLYDYYYQQWGTFSNVPAVSSCIYNELHTYVDKYGRVFQETPGQYTDNNKPVLMSFTTSWFNLAGLQGFERLYYFLMLGTFISPFKLNVQIGYNYNPNPQQSFVVTPDNYTPAYGSGALYGSDPSYGGTKSVGLEGQANVFEARCFNSIQKVESFQLTINEIYDSSFGTTPGGGLTLSGLNLVVGAKRGFRTNRANRNFG